MSILAMYVTIATILLCSQGQQQVNSRAKTASTQNHPNINRQPHGGDDIVQVIERLIKSGATNERGEFETTTEYEARRKVIPLPKGDISLFVETVIFNYNADSAEMTARMLADITFLPGAPATVPRSPDGSILFGRSFTLRLHSVTRQESFYVGTNAYGAKQRIKYTAYDDYGVRLAPDSSINIDKNAVTPILAFTFSLDRNRARDLKPFVRAAISGTVIEPQVWHSHEVHKPTFDEPYETERNGLYITLRLDGVKVLDSRSGEVVSSFTRDMKVQ